MGDVVGGGGGKGLRGWGVIWEIIWIDIRKAKAWDTVALNTV